MVLINPLSDNDTPKIDVKPICIHQGIIQRESPKVLLPKYKSQFQSNDFLESESLMKNSTQSKPVFQGESLNTTPFIEKKKDLIE